MMKLKLCFSLENVPWNHINNFELKLLIFNDNLLRYNTLAHHHLEQQE